MSTAAPAAPAAVEAPVGELPRRPQRSDIQALRALAVAAVVAFHAGVPGLRGGFTGVDVFFVISGFLVTGHLLRLERGGAVRGWVAFYGRRILRLLPAATTVLVATALLARWLLDPLQYRAAGRDALTSALYVVNVHLADSRIDYFTEVQPSVFQHYWSLAVEEQFYLLWPFVVLLLTVALGRGRRTVGVVLALATVASFALAYRLTTTIPLAAFYLLPTRVWEFGVGALLALAAPWLAARRPRPARATTWVGVVALVVGMVLVDDRAGFPGWQALVPVLGTAAVIAGGTAGPAGVPVRVGAWRPVAWVGAASYPLYLWHWPLLVVPALRQADPLPAGERALLVGAGVVLAALTHHLVEDPARSSRFLRARPHRPFVLLVVLTVVASGAALWLGRVPALATTTMLPEWPAGAAPAAAPTPTVVGANLRPTLAAARDDRPATAGTDCFVPLESDRVKACTFGDTTATTTLALFGDSHAQQWLPAFNALGRARHVRVVTFLKAGCAPAVVPLLNARYGDAYTACDRWRTDALAEVRDLRPDVVVAGWSAGETLRDDDDRAATWAGGTRELVEQVGGSRVVVLGDGPVWPSSRPACLAENLRDADRCTRPVSDVVDAPVQGAIATAARAAGGEFFDTTSLLCPGGRCPGIMWDVGVYSDDDHLTATFALEVRLQLQSLLPRG